MEEIEDDEDGRTQAHAQSQAEYAYTNAHSYTCIHTHALACIHTHGRTHTQTHTRTDTRTHAHAHAHAYTHTDGHTHGHKHGRTHGDTHTHTHTHTRTLKFINLQIEMAVVFGGGGNIHIVPVNQIIPVVPLGALKFSKHPKGGTIAFGFYDICKIL